MWGDFFRPCKLRQSQPFPRIPRRVQQAISCHEERKGEKQMWEWAEESRARGFGHFGTLETKHVLSNPQMMASHA